MSKNRIIITILMCIFLLLTMDVFAITYGKVGADTNFNGNINIPSGCKYYINGVEFTAGDVTNWVIPQDYATGTGTVGDPWAGSCIEDAFAAVSEGGTIYLREGFYQMDGALDITKSVNIIGEGMGKTIIRTVAGTADGFTSGEVDYITIKNLTIDGDAQTLDTNNQGIIQLNEGDYIVIENVEVMNGGNYGIDINRCNYALLQNVYSHANYKHGVHGGTSLTTTNKYMTYRNIFTYSNGVNGFDDTIYDIAAESTYNVYDNINAWGNTGDGIYIGRNNNVSMTNCSSYDNGSDNNGISIYDVEDSVISNYTSISDDSAGMYIYTCNNVTVENCNITLSIAYGIVLEDSDDINLTNVVVGTIGADDDIGIKIEDCESVTLTACQSYGSNYGMYLTGTNTNVSLLSCDLSGNDSGEIYGTTAGIVLAVDGVVDGTKAVAGDIQYHNGTNWVRLAKGTAGQVLEMNAGVTAPEWDTDDTGAGVPTTITVANEATDTSCYPLFVTAATGDLGPKTVAGLSFNSNTSILTATGFAGPLTGNVTGNASGTAATVTGATQASITTCANLVSVGTITTGVWNGTTVKANYLQTTAADLGAANVEVVLSNTNGAYVTNLTTDGTITAGAFAGALTGNVTGNCSGTAATVTGAAQASITSLGNLTGLAIVEGGVINWDSSDFTITQTGNNLNFDGGEIDFNANSVGFTQQAITYNVTETIVDWKLSNKATVTLTGNVGTFSFTNPTNPCNLLVKIVQDVTGSRVITAWDTDIKWAGGTKPTLTTTANGIDICSFYFDGTNYFGVASLAFATP